MTASFSVELAVNGSFMRLKNTSKGSGALTKCILTITSVDDVAYRADIVALGKVTDSIGPDGVKLYPSDFSRTDGAPYPSSVFEDGYYQLTLLVSDGTEASATINEGFTSAVEAAINRLILGTVGESSVVKVRRAQDVTIAVTLVRSAKADARIGNAVSFHGKIRHVYRVFKKEVGSYE